MVIVTDKCGGILHAHGVNLAADYALVYFIAEGADIVRDDFLPILDGAGEGAIHVKQCAFNHGAVCPPLIIVES